MRGGWGATAQRAPLQPRSAQLVARLLRPRAAEPRAAAVDARALLRPSQSARDPGAPGCPPSARCVARRTDLSKGRDVSN